MKNRQESNKSISIQNFQQLNLDREHQTFCTFAISK